MSDDAWRSERELASLSYDELVDLAGLRRSDMYVMGRAHVLQGRWSAARSAFRHAATETEPSRRSLAWSYLSTRAASIPGSTERTLAPPEVDPVEREAGEALPVAASLALAAARLPSSRDRLLRRCDDVLGEVLKEIPDHPQALELQAATSWLKGDDEAVVRLGAGSRESHPSAIWEAIVLASSKLTGGQLARASRAARGDAAGWHAVRLRVMGYGAALLPNQLVVPIVVAGLAAAAILSRSWIVAGVAALVILVAFGFMAAWGGAWRPLLFGLALSAGLFTFLGATAPVDPPADGREVAATFAQAVVHGDASAAVAVADPMAAAFWKEHLGFPIDWSRDNHAVIDSITGGTSEGYTVRLAGTFEGTATGAEMTLLIGSIGGETRVIEWSFSVSPPQGSTLSQVAL